MLIDSILKFVADKLSKTPTFSQDVGSQLMSDAGYTPKETCLLHIKASPTSSGSAYLYINQVGSPSITRYVALTNDSGAPLTTEFLAIKGFKYTVTETNRINTVNAYEIPLGGATLKLATLLHIRKEVAACL